MENKLYRANQSSVDAFGDGIILMHGCLIVRE